MTNPRKSSRSRQVRPERERPLALAYIRVSTREQADEGASLPAQRAKLIAECERRGWDCEIVADEGVSAKNVAGRPGMVGALKRLDAGEADVLVAVRLDRISRSVLDFGAMLERSARHGWSLSLLDMDLDTSTPVGRLIAHVIAAVCQFEREQIAVRTKEGMVQRVSEGVVMGRPQEMCPELRDRIAAATAGGTSYAELARQLNAEDIPTPRGGRWHASTVRRAAITPDRVCRCSSDGDVRVPAADCPRHSAADSRLSRLEEAAPSSAQVTVGAAA